MVGLNNTGKGIMLEAIDATFAFASLHTDDPGTGGTSEVTGGTPAYARKALSWAAASGGTKSSDGPLVFDVPASTTIKFLGYWSLVSGGTFYGSRALDTNQTFATQGTYTVAAGDVDEVLT